ncbi:multidrug ABC transporter ATP-binding protein [Actinorhabdospora filicis]|uniref:Multidrug ABC transporter ATP-binding protein n=1 Tax=Actinorhabdospora filicis TaxID=1785913 RepID=A0A9W6SG56_9ACTN|nr:ABC transporter ATP-binding protein [Actinorhabdospora filicis]GLZ76544.1 multidrug ABC transporter ATP-binding protein [Actinorhabdospora filicis]
MSTDLPVADPPEVRKAAWELLRSDPKRLTAVIALHLLAAVTGLAGPWFLGDLIDRVRAGTTTATIDLIALSIAGFVVVNAVLTRFARYTSFKFGETLLARLRETFIEKALALPLSTVERAGTGDLMTRSSQDVDALGSAVRFAVPEMLVAIITISATFVAMLVISPVLALSALICVPSLFLVTRWYLRRARAVYISEGRARSAVNEQLATTVEGARTIEALGIAERRVERSEAGVRAFFGLRMQGLRLRTVWFPVAEFTYLIPLVTILVLGGLLYMNDLATVGAVTAVALYANQIIEPVDRLLMWMENLQVGSASFARVLGVGKVPADREEHGVEPEDDRIAAEDVRYSYVDGADVLHGVGITVRPGERLAMVGPSGAGKSTLGRLIAGVDRPRTGSVSVGGAEVTGLPLGELRQRIALVTQEHHVFLGTLRDNLALARPEATDDEIHAALNAVDADWAAELPEGLDTGLGAGKYEVSPAQAQQIALARLVLADPHTLVLDEATSLLDPRAARHLERSLAAVLEGRTVIAIAHRLHTAHDADRVAVVAGGRIAELGSHDELIEADGDYAALWRSWRS